MPPSGGDEPKPYPDEPGCYNRTESGNYDVPVFSTMKGEVCDLWFNHQNGEYNHNDNLCRNPEPEHFERPWCFNQHGKRRVCDVPECAVDEPEPEKAQCKISSNLKPCELEIILDGNCFYKGKTNVGCDFDLTQKDRETYEVWTEGSGAVELDFMNDEKKWTDQKCGITVEVGFDKATIKFPMCQMCSVLIHEEHLANPSPDDQCPGLPGYHVP